MRAEVQVNIFLKPGLSVGPDAIGLLGAIVETGSIAAAARASSISYKKAWHMVDRLNASFKTPLVKASKGGDRRGGAVLTEAGRGVITFYRAIQAAAASRANELQELAALAT